MVFGMDSCQSQWKQFQVTSFLFDWIHFHSLYLETIAVSRYPSLRVYKFLPFKGIKFVHSHPTVVTQATHPALGHWPSSPASLLTHPPALEGCEAVLRSRRLRAALQSPFLLPIPPAPQLSLQLRSYPSCSASFGGVASLPFPYPLGESCGAEGRVGLGWGGSLPPSPIP